MHQQRLVLGPAWKVITRMYPACVPFYNRSTAPIVSKNNTIPFESVLFYALRPILGCCPGNAGVGGWL